MVESFLTQDMIIQGEPSLRDYVFQMQVNYDDIIDESFREMLQDLQNQSLKLRQLCKRYYLESASLTKTSSYDGAWTTNPDEVERLRLVIETTAHSGTAFFRLEGRNSSSETGVNVLKFSVSQAGKHSFLINDVYKYYRLRLMEVGASVTYERPYLIEDTYTYLHKLKTRAKIYHSLIATEGGEYQGKFEQYQTLYEYYLTNSKFPYDEDESGDIDQIEAEDDVTEVRFRA